MADVDWHLCIFAPPLCHVVVESLDQNAEGVGWTDPGSSLHDGLEAIGPQLTREFSSLQMGKVG